MAEFADAQKDLGILNVHLVSGEDIIGRVFDKTDAATNGEYYVIVNPVIPNVRMSKDATGQPQFGVGLLPIRPYLGGLKEVEIPKVYAMYIVPVLPAMEQMYLQFTSGLVLPNGPGLLQG